MRHLAVFFISLILVACAQPKKAEIPVSELYLRADFTYWEARPAYKFKLNKERGVKFLTSFIKYDGQPYQIVIADRAWSADKNCGFAKRSDRELRYNEWIPLECNYDIEKNSVTPIQKPFKFLPKGSGKYLFELQLNGIGQPTHIRINGIKSKSVNKKL